MIGHIYLVKDAKQKIIPAVILNMKEETLILAQIKSYSADEDNTIQIGRPKGLKDSSVVMLYKVFKAKKSSLVKQLAEIPMKNVEEIMMKYEELAEKDRLHKRLHQLKAEILRAQCNNEDYTDKENEVDQILKKIGYQKVNRPREKGFYNYREVPTKGWIKVYHGGRN
ncbi:hypothetical protein [Paenibacillus dakarensis]|uniref:hypothetical protein n=1 Tax=Paenibacillus dakarensis TaxID=1527293 RepID=UPI0006D5357B|nr:hypothetical protein [Paenibacillus dakarensis]